MHGWISLPVFWQLFLLCVAPLVGVAAGYWLRHSKRQARLWPLVSLAYAFGVVLVAFEYEQLRHPGFGYEFGPWLIFVVPLFVFALPSVGLPWAAVRHVLR
jgi:hypothetical protein